MTFHPHRFSICDFATFETASMSDLKAGRRPHSGFLDLRRFKVPSAVVYALFILVIYSHAVLARQQFTLRRSYLKVAGRESAARIHRRPETTSRGSRPRRRRPRIMGNEKRWERKRVMTPVKKKEAAEERPRVAGERINPGRASFRVRSRRHLWTVGARNIKSRGARSVLTANTL